MIDQKEMDEIHSRMIKTEEQGFENVLKHFDRLHDKLFDVNNILIAGYFVLAQLNNSISTKVIIAPVINLIVLIYIEWRMMEKNRFLSDIRNKPMNEIGTLGKMVDAINAQSLLIIATTALVVAFFLYLLF